MPEPASPRLFLIDGYALIYRAFYALIGRPLTTARGENTSAVWGIANFLQRLIERHHPEYVAWVHDSGLSFRHEVFPEYKATRERLTEELQADFDTGIERIQQLLSAYGIRIITLDGYEADDVIGTLARQAVQKAINTVIVSGDKDFQQLVQPGVWLLNPGRGGPAAVEEHWVSVENASERLGVAPQRVTDYLALIGDSSDNVPGVPGIGGKTAVELIEQFGDLESIIAHAGDIAKKRPREALLANIDKARLSKRLVTIRDDLPIELDPGQLRTSPPDRVRLRDLYIELEFHTLVRDLGEPEEASVRVAPEGAYKVVDNAGMLAAVVEKARAAGRIGINTESSYAVEKADRVDALQARLIGLSIAIGEGESYYFPFAHTATVDEQGEFADLGGVPAPQTKRKGTARGTRGVAAQMLAEASAEVVNLPSLASDQLEPLRALLEDPGIRKVGQNLKYDMLLLRGSGVTLRGVELDTMIASYVLDPGRRSHGLALLALEFLGHSVPEYGDLVGKGREALSFDRVPVMAACRYSCESVDAAFRLALQFEPRMREHGLTPLFRNIEMPLIPVLCEMEWTGISIDLNWFRSLKERFLRERERVAREIFEVAGGEFNINSNQQLREIMFDKMGLPVIKRTATGPSTDASVLQQFADQGEKLPALILEYRELAKLENTYLDALPALVNPRTGRLHTSFNQTVASTGRLSSSDPNLQNIPIRRELGRDIRRGFVPRPGWRLMAADYSQIELRLLAHLSADPVFVAAFNSGGDIHRQTASLIFGVDVGDVTPEMRARAKTINFATIYGQGAHALSQQLGIDYAEARLFIATYFERFSGIRAYLDSRVEFAREHGYVETIHGRRRYIPELRDRNFNIRAFGERTAANSPIQGSAADLIKVAMINIDHALNKSGMRARMLLQVHDELVFEMPPEEEERMTTLVKHEMENAATLIVPLVVDIGVGDNWVSAKSGA